MWSELLIYTDGACSVNPGKGGHGMIAILGNNGVPQVQFIHSGFKAQTTNNEQELSAMLSALVFSAFCFDKGILHPDARVQIVTDSQYCEKGINSWIYNWARDGFMKKGAPIPNARLWKAVNKIRLHLRTFVYEQTGTYADPFTITWVKGHSTDALNNMVDKIAVNACQTGTGMTKRIK